MSIDRRKTRILALQALCQWDVQGDESSDSLRDFLVAQAGTEAGTRYAADLVEGFWSQRDNVDGRIQSAATSWDLSRISPVERNIMRVAIVEMIGGKVPPKVALDEAVEIGREFGGAESPRFINGVLDAILQTLQRPEKDDR